MKYIHMLFCLLAPFIGFAQSIQYQISGTLPNTNDLGYIYLVSNGNKQILKTAKIINGKYQFEGTADLEGQFLRYAFLFIDSNSNISLDVVNSKLKNKIWVIGKNSNLKSIILENMSLSTKDLVEMDQTEVVKGGEWNKQLDEKSLALKENKFKEFIEKYPDSPVSFSLLKGAIKYYMLPIRADLEEKWGYPDKLFSLFSIRLQNSAQGKELKKEIDALNSK